MTALVLLVLFPPFAASSSPGTSLAPAVRAEDSSARFQKRLARIEALFEAGKVEPGCRLAWRLRGDLARAERSTVLNTLRKKTRQLLLRWDRHCSERIEAQKAAAKALEPIVRDFRMGKQPRTAWFWSEFAARLDVEPVALQRKLLGRQFAKILRPKSGDVECRLGEAEFSKEISRWKVEKGVYSSPVFERGSSEVLVATRPEHGDGEVSVELKLPMKHYFAGIILGHTRPGEMCILEWMSFDDGLPCIRLCTIHENRPKIVAQQYLTDPDLQEIGWLRIGARIEGKKVSLQVAGETRTSCRLEEAPHGQLGLYVSAANKQPKSVPFRELHVIPAEELREEVHADADAEYRVTDLLFEGGELLAAAADSSGTGDDASLARALELESALARILSKKRAAEVEVMTVRLRRYSTRASEKLQGHHPDRTAAAKALLPLVSVYRERKWERSAQDVLGAMRFLDPSVAPK